jgi:hypothetical protein
LRECPHGVAAAFAGGSTGRARGTGKAACGAGGDEWGCGPRRAEQAWRAPAAEGGGGEEGRGAGWERRGGEGSHGGGELGLRFFQPPVAIGDAKGQGRQGVRWVMGAVRA